jgi:signal transduction histidine kinase/ligand-binding sensor domain-containing protein
VAADFPFTQPQFERVSNVDMIDSQPITALAQDARGLIWIGTQGGLVRYDGYRFRKFVHNINDPFSIAGDYVNALLAAKDGRLWVGTLSDGVSVFDPATERFTHIRHDEKKSDSLGGGMIWDLAEDQQGGIWIATEQGLHHLPRSSKRLVQFTHASHSHSLMDDKVRSLLWDKTGRLWVGSNSGLQRLASDGKTFETIMSGKSVEALFQAQDGKVWLGTREYGAAWIMAGGVPSGGVPLGGAPSDGAPPEPVKVNWLPLAQLSHPWVHKIIQAQPDQIWLATFGGGINIVAASDGHLLQTLRHDSALTSSLAMDDIKPMLLDRSGWLWVGTWGAGLQRMNASNNMVRILRHSPKQANGLSHPNIRSVLELSNGNLLFGSNGNGIDVFDKQQGLIKSYKPHDAKASGTNLSESLPDATITALAQTSDGSIWAGTRQAGVIRQLAGSATWVAVPGWSEFRVRKFLSSRDGSLFVGTTRGVVRWRPGTTLSTDEIPAVERFETLTDKQGKPMQSNVNSMAQDEQGRIWIGSSYGLWLQETPESGLIPIHAEPNRPTGLISDYIGSLLFDRSKRLWISTDKGLERLQNWDGKQAHFEHISALLGQPGKHMGANLLEDREGRIWSEEMVIDPVRMRKTDLTAADGMDGGAHWLGSYGQTRDGLMLFGGTKGVVIIDPARFKAYDYLPPLVITELKINGETMPSGALLHGKAASRTLSLTPAQRNFAIEFAALDYADPSKNSYQYRLQGYDNKWINADANHRIAAYGNLWPGLYHLQVRGSNRIGQWSPHELMIPIRVLPAWWQTWWFLALMLLLLVCTMLASLRWRMAHLRNKAQTLQTLIDARTADILNLAEIGRELTATLDTEQAFDRVHRQVSARLDADVFLIGILDEAKAHIVFVYKIEHRQRLPNAIMDLNEQQRAAVWCVRNQRELIANNSQELRTYLGEILPPSTGEPMETVVYLPLLAEQRVIGCLSVQSPRQHAYSKDQLEFLRILASYTAIALSNSAAHSALTQSHEALAQSHEELEDALQHLKTTQAKLIQAERQQISLDLHDNLSQTMTGILLQLDTAREALISEGKVARVRDALEDTKSGPINRSGASLTYVDRAIELARDGITQTRHLLNQLRTKKSKPASINLVDALRRDLPRLTVGTPINVSVEQHGGQIALPATLELVFFRIAQEAVTNALRHSKAKLISVLLTYEAENVILEVRDDGNGFDPTAPGHAPGIGLLGMRERVTALAGRFDITSAPGKGTCITAALPILVEYT